MENFIPWFAEKLSCIAVVAIAPKKSELSLLTLTLRRCLIVHAMQSRSCHNNSLFVSRCSDLVFLHTKSSSSSVRFFSPIKFPSALFLPRDPTPPLSERLANKKFLFPLLQGTLKQLEVSGLGEIEL